MQSGSKKTENHVFRLIDTKSKSNNNTLQPNLNGCDQFSTLNGSVQKSDTNRKKIFDVKPESQYQLDLKSIYSKEIMETGYKNPYENDSYSDKYLKFKGEIKQSSQQSTGKQNQSYQARSKQLSNQTNQNECATISYQELNSQNCYPTQIRFEKKENESNVRNISNNQYFKNQYDVATQNSRSQYEISQANPEIKYENHQQQMGTISQSQQQQRNKTEQYSSCASNYYRFKASFDQQINQSQQSKSQEKNQNNNGDKNEEQYVESFIFQDQQQQNQQNEQYVFSASKVTSIQNSQVVQNHLEQSKSKQVRNIFVEIDIEQNKSLNTKTIELSLNQDQQQQQEKSQTNQDKNIGSKNSSNLYTQSILLEKSQRVQQQNNSIEQVQNQNNDVSEKDKIFTNIKLPENYDDTQESDTQLQVSKYIDNNQNEQEIAQEGSAEQLSASKILSKHLSQQSDTKEQNFAPAQNTLKELSDSLQKPIKVSNFLFDGNQCQQVKQLQSNFKSQKNKCNIVFNEQFTVLMKMNQERQSRKKDIEYVSKILYLSETDCLTDIQSGKQKANIILVQFPLIRRVRGDGNCLYTSLVFPYLELLSRKKQFASILNQFEAQEIFWNNDVLIEIPMVYQLIRQIFIQLQKLSEQCGDDFNKFSQILLHYFNKENGFYDLMIIFIRSIVIQSFKKYSKSDYYCNFVQEDSLFEYIEKIATFEEEGEFLEIQFFSEITQIKIKLINFTNPDPISQMEIVEPKININKSDTDKFNFITLKYNNGHYDILYSQMQKFVSADKQILEQDELLKIDFTPLY